MVLRECFRFFLARTFSFSFILLSDNWDVGVLGTLLAIVANRGNALIGAPPCEDYVRSRPINNSAYNLVGLSQSRPTHTRPITESAHEKYLWKNKLYSWLQVAFLFFKKYKLVYQNYTMCIKFTLIRKIYTFD